MFRTTLFTVGRAMRTEISVRGNSVLLSRSDEMHFTGRHEIEFPLSTVRAVRLSRYGRCVDMRPRWKGGLRAVILAVLGFLGFMLPIVAGDFILNNLGHFTGFSVFVLLSVLLWEVLFSSMVAFGLIMQLGFNCWLIVRTDECRYVFWFKHDQYGRFSEYVRMLTSQWRIQAAQSSLQKEA